MAGEPRVVVVSVGEPPAPLIVELRQRGLIVSESAFSDAEEEIENHDADLVVLFGSRGAMELATLLDDPQRRTRPRLAIVAGGRELSRLWGLNREVVISLLASEMSARVIAERVQALAKQWARPRSERGSLKPVEPPPSESKPVEPPPSESKPVELPPSEGKTAPRKVDAKDGDLASLLSLGPLFDPPISPPKANGSPSAVEEAPSPPAPPVRPATLELLTPPVSLEPDSAAPVSLKPESAVPISIVPDSAFESIAPEDDSVVLESIPPDPLLPAPIPAEPFRLAAPRAVADPDDISFLSAPQPIPSAPEPEPAAPAAASPPEPAPTPVPAEAIAAETRPAPEELPSATPLAALPPAAPPAALPPAAATPPAVPEAPSTSPASWRPPERPLPNKGNPKVAVGILAALVLGTGVLWLNGTFTRGPESDGKKPTTATAPAATSKAPVPPPTQEAPTAPPADTAAPTETAVADTAAAPATGTSDEGVNPFLIADAKLPGCDELARGVLPLTPDPTAEASAAWTVARQAIVKGDLKVANKKMCEAVTLHPESAAIEGLVLLYSTLNSPSEALRWAERAELVRPGQLETQNLLATVHSQLGATERALEVWLKALHIQPDELSRRQIAAKNDTTVARGHLKQGDLPRAERLLRRAVTLDPSNAIALASMAEICLKQQRPACARIFARQSLAIFETNPDAYLVLGDAALLSGDRASAQASYERALAVRPDFWAATLKLRALDQ